MALMYFHLNNFFYFLFENRVWPRRLYSFSHSVIIGFLISFFNRKDLQKIDELRYNQSKKYFTDEHNRKIFNWEEEVVEKCFSEVRTILIIAVGGGREAYYLHKMGYEVHPYEYNQNLREYGNLFFKNEGMPISILPVKPDAFPESDRLYDAVIIGWGAYNHIRGTEKRVKLLKDGLALLNPNGRILVSYWPYRFCRLNLERVYRIGNKMSQLFKKEKVEHGDIIFREFGHYFPQGTADKEVAEAGFKIVYSTDKEYGVVVGEKA